MTAAARPSYPYLVVARRYGADYGTVLSYADWLDRLWYGPDEVPEPPRFAAARRAAALGNWAAAACLAWETERKWRSS